VKGLGSDSDIKYVQSDLLVTRIAFYNIGKVCYWQMRIVLIGTMYYCRHFYRGC
jgi:hypothetical protein